MLQSIGKRGGARIGRGPRGERKVAPVRILFSGFEPFDGMAVNPSWEAVRLLPERIGPAQVHRVRLPVVFGQAAEILLAEAARLRPEVVILVGVAQGRRGVTPEKIAINYQNARIADNAGHAPQAQPIAADGPDGIITHLPAEAMVSAMQDAGLPAQLSLSAGAYVCNDLYYRTALQEAALGYRCIFVHVPGTEVLAPEQAAEALRLCGQVAVEGVVGG